MQHGRHDDLDCGDVLAHLLVVVVLVDLPRGVQHHQPELLQLRVRVRDVLLHGLLVGQQAARGLAAQHPLAHHVDRLLGQADRAHGMVDPASAEAGLSDDEGLPFTAEQRRVGHPHVVVVDEGVTALALAFAVQSDVAHDVDAGSVGGHQEHRHAAICADVGVGHHHDDQERRRIRVGGEVLPAVDHPVVTVAHRGGLELGGVGTALGFGHRVTGEQLAVQQGAQVALLLLGGAVVRDDLGVAGVGGLASEDDRRPLRSTEDLVEQCQLQLAVALAAELWAEMRGPQPLLANLLLQRVDDLAARLGERSELQVRPDEVEWFDLIAHECVRPVQQLLVVRVGLEIPHAASLPSVVRIR